MNTISQIGKQITELFESLTPSARIMAGLMMGVIFVSLGWILSQQQAASKTHILGILTPEELRRAEEAFGAAMLSDYEISNGTRIQVPAAQKAVYMKALADGGAIPMQWGDKMKEAMQTGIFDPPSLINQRQDHAEEQELAGLLRRVPQIDFAAVQYDEKRAGFGRETEKVCSIHVQQYGNRPIDIAVLKHIAEQATRHFAGLRKENVSVFDLGTSNIYRASSDPLASDDNPLLAAQASWEDHYDRKVRELLTPYGAVKVGVSVELDNKLTEASERLQYDPTGVSTESVSSKKDSESQKAPPGGRPGANPNALNNPQSIAATSPEQTSKVKELQESTRNQYGTEAIVTRTAGLNPKEVKVSVGVPESYYREVHAFRWRLANPDSDPTQIQPPTAQELATIEDETKLAITSAIETIPIGVREAADRKTFINVYAYPVLPLPAIPEPSLAETGLAWLSESWSTLAMIGLVLISLGMMFSWVRSQQADPELEKQFANGFGLQLPDKIADEFELSTTIGPDGETVTRQGPSFEVSGEEMKQDLSTLIKDNPDAAVNLLKTWIGEAA